MDSGGQTLAAIKDYRLQLKIRNNRILQRIQEEGFTSIPTFCRTHDLQYGAVAALIAMSDSALTAAGEWRPIVQKLATALRVLPEHLFNERQALAEIENRVVEREVSEEEVVALTSSEALALTDQSLECGVEMREGVARAMDALTPRQRDVIERRFGFRGNAPETHEEIAADYGVSGPRIRQIEQKALRIMRPPSAVSPKPLAAFCHGLA